MTRRITATEAARTFSDVVNRVLYRGEDFVVERAGAPVCRIGPLTPSRCTVEELSRLLAELPKLDAAYLATVERAVRRQPPMPGSPWR